MKMSMILDAICILNYNKAQKLVAITEIFSAVRKSYFSNHDYLDNENQKRRVENYMH